MIAKPQQLIIIEEDRDMELRDCVKCVRVLKNYRSISPQNNSRRSFFNRTEQLHVADTNEFDIEGPNRYI